MLFLLDVNDAGQKLKKECEKTSDCQSPLLHCNDHNKCDILSTHLCHEPADCLTGHCRDGHCVESSKGPLYKKRASLERRLGTSCDAKTPDSCNIPGFVCETESDKGVCKATSRWGFPCKAHDLDNLCTGESWCDMSAPGGKGKCLPKKSTLSPCDKDNECISDRCIDGHCGGIDGYGDLCHSKEDKCAAEGLVCQAVSDSVTHSNKLMRTCRKPEEHGNGRTCDTKKTNTCLEHGQIATCYKGECLDFRTAQAQSCKTNDDCGAYRVVGGLGVSTFACEKGTCHIKTRELGYWERFLWKEADTQIA